MLASYLYKSSTSSSQTSTPSASASGTLADAPKSLAAAFSKAFAPYTALSFTSEDRCEHMLTLANETAELGIWLFGQPCVFEFVWEYTGDGSGSRNGFCVTPGVVKVADERGARFRAPFVVVERSEIEIVEDDHDDENE
ncbi:hypothetical protein BJX70DRAFT_219084 [Aspergillus crustosus]